MSGGQKQRISIARTLLKDSDIMIFDEPTSSLDSKSKQNIYETFKRLKNTGKTLIIVSHDPEVSSHVDRVIELSNGNLISQKGTR